MVADARDEGLHALDYYDLCAPLRRVLFWYAVSPPTPRPLRRMAHQLLKRLQDALIPALPPKERVVFDEVHAEHYQSFLKVVKTVWKETREYGLEHMRRKELEKRLLVVECLADAERLLAERKLERAKAQGWIRRREEFWKRCGDLRHARAAHVSACLMKLGFELPLEPDAIKDRLTDVQRAYPFHRQALALGDVTWSEFIQPP